MTSHDQVDLSDDKTRTPMYDRDTGIHQASSDGKVDHGDIVLEETTKRGLKARHAQMIALGGTIGKSAYY